MAKRETPAPEKLAASWLDRIKDVQEKDCNTWYGQAEESYARYKNATGESAKTPNARVRRKFNAHWSNTEVLMPAMLSDEPKVNCGRRNKDKNPTALLAATILERCTQFSVQSGGLFMQSAEASVLDYLLAGRGTIWARYDPTFGPEETQQTRVSLTPFKGYHDEAGTRYETGDVLEDDLGKYVAGESFKPVVAERVCMDFVHYRDFVHGPAATWDMVPWVARRVHMRKRKVADRFGKHCAAIISQTKENEERKDPKRGASSRGTIEIWEIWDKERGQVRWLCEFYKEGFLDEVDDPLSLQDFFPCPRPLLGTHTPDSLIPVPDFEQYKDQLAELDRITDRGMRLAHGIRVAGVYDKQYKELQKLFNETDDDNYVGVDTFAAFADKGGLKSAMDTLPIKDIVAALQALSEVRQTVKGDLYEISGLSDIMRGDTDPNETLGAQNLKANFGSKRLKKRQKDVARFLRDAVAIIAEIIAEHFRPEEIVKMSGAEQLGDEQTVMAAIQLLQDQGAREFEIDIETDSTVAVDEEAEKQATVEFVTAVTQYLEQAGLIGQQSPAMVPLLLEMLMFAVRRFKAGRDLEQTFEKTVEAVLQEQQQKQQNPQPDPEMQKIQMEGQAKQQELQAKLQADQAKLQIDQQKGATDLQIKQAELQIKRDELELRRQEMQMTLQLKAQEGQQKLAIQAQQGQQKLDQTAQQGQMQMAQEHAQHGDEMAMRQQEGAQGVGLEREKMQMQAEQSESKGEADGMTQAAKSMSQAAEALTKVAAVLAKALAPSKKAA